MQAVKAWRWCTRCRYVCVVLVYVLYTLPSTTAEVAMSRKKACPFSAGAATVSGFVPSSACALTRKHKLPALLVLVYSYTLYPYVVCVQYLFY